MNSHLNARDLLGRLPDIAESAEVYEQHRRQTPVKFAAGALEAIKSLETTGRALRVIRQGRLGFATTSDLNDEALLVRSALAAAEFGGPAPFSFPTRQPPAAVQCFDPAVERLAEREMIEMGKEAVATVLAAHPDVQVDAQIWKTIDEVRLVNSSGLEISHRTTSLELGISVQRSREGDILMLWDQVASRRRQDIAVRPLTDYLVERLRLADRPARARAGKMPVVFSRTALLTLFIPLLNGLSGRSVLQGSSPLGDKLGQAVLAPEFDLIDDARLDFALLAAPYDDEGVPTSRKALISGGVVRQFLYDLRTAGLAGAQSTGNGFKGNPLMGGGVNRPPDISPGTWIVSPGTQSLAQILQGLDEALLVEALVGMGQGNTMAGEFSNNVGLGFLVRRGEIVGRVKNTMIAGNIYELLQDRLIALSSEPEDVSGWLRSPAIALDGVGVAC